MKGIIESQKVCHGEEVKSLFSEALEGRPEPMKGQRYWEADFAKIIIIIVTICLTYIKPLLCSRYYAKYFHFIISFNPHNNLMKRILISFSFCQLEN